MTGAAFKHLGLPEPARDAGQFGLFSDGEETQLIPARNCVRMTAMKPFKERAAEALELLPEEMQERAVAYIFEQAEKYRVLKNSSMKVLPISKPERDRLGCRIFLRGG